jgi:mono/diheme cytochrome c family protein
MSNQLVLTLGTFAALWLSTHLDVCASEANLDARLSQSFQETIRPILKTHCGDCHMGDANEAGVNFEVYQDLNKIREHSSSWEQIRGVIQADAMPPPESSELKAEDRQTLVSWIRSALHDIECDCEVPVPPVTLRRLNRVEYDNTIRDLLGLEFNPSQDIAFLSDDVGNGFDNQGEVLSMPPIMLEKYLDAANLVANRTVKLDRESMREQNIDGDSNRFGTTQNIKAYLAAGQYRMTVRMRFGDRQKDKAYAIIRWNDETLREIELKTNTSNFDFEVVAVRGMNTLSVVYFNDDEPSRKNDPNRRIFIDSVKLRGPKNAEPSFPLAHERFVIAYPEDREAPDEPPLGREEATRRVFAEFLPRAYRRPVSASEIDDIVKLCTLAQESGATYLEAIRYGLRATLVSPQFLFRAEERSVDGSLDDFAIASRLSYFLWSTMPDEELMQLAKENRLHEPDVLKSQVGRMIESQRSSAFIQGFFGQWLGLRNINKIDIDQNKYLGWNERLRAAMIRETEMFCSDVLRNGRIDDLLEAKHTYVNPRLAEFYGVSFDGIDPVDLYPMSTRFPDGSRRLRLFEREGEWVKVELPANRRGVLTQAAVLTLTSNPTRTSPVKRGKWILENVLGTPPPSAPPNVPSLEESKAADGALLRERLEIHRSNPSCAGCHKIMDPIGLGLENFDAVGRWREKDEGKPIDSQGELADGTKFSTPAELVEILALQKQQLVENLAVRMLTYALGRGLQREDRCGIKQITAYTNDRNRTFRSLVEAVVLNDSFCQRTSYLPALPTN